MCIDKPNATAINTASSGETHNSSSLTTQGKADLRNFLGKAQMMVLARGCTGEESAYFKKTLADLALLFSTMPKTYAQEDKGDQAVVHLHYFMGAMDWFITERDLSDEQLQAFGLCDLGMGYPEMGYVCIPEITAAGAELDLHWKPKTLAEIKKARA